MSASEIHRAASDDGFALHATERSRVGEARRLTRALAERAGLGPARQEEIAIVASELAANLVAHAPGGWFLAQRIGPAIDLLTLDRGPGLPDIEQCFVDGYSTAGTSGIGLGAVRRLSTEHAIDTGPDRGTIFFVRCGRPPDVGVEFGTATRPYPGQRRNGDGWLIDQVDSITRVFVLDGLGHGPSAADASEAALDALRGCTLTDPVPLLEVIDGALVSTRGAAATVACIDADAERVSIAGVGNVSGVIYHQQESMTVVPKFGVLGNRSRLADTRSLHGSWGPGALLVMHTDGVSEKWRSGGRRRGLRRSPALVAGRLLRDHGRRTDDATALVVHAREAA
ncbi:MAG: SpoIIE family protein phosphatase [bacterium]